MNINHKTHCETGILYEDIKEFLNLDFKITNLSYDEDKKVLNIVQNPDIVVSCSMKELPNRKQIEDLIARIRNEVTRAMAAERDLGIKIKEESEVLKVLIEGIQKEVLDSIRTFRLSLDSANAAISSEITRAITKENALEKIITDNANNVSNIIQGVDIKIDEEINRAKKQEEVMVSTMNDKELSMNSKISSISADLQREIQRSISTDDYIKKELNDAVSDLSVEINRIDGKLNTYTKTEINTKLAEILEDSKKYTDSLKDTEVATNTSNIAHEIERAQAEEKILKANIAANKSSLDSIILENDSENSLVYYLKKDNKIIGTINIPKDQFLKSVDIEDKTNNLVFTFVTDSGEVTTKVDFSKYIDIYSKGDGVDIINKAINIHIDPSSETYLTVSSTGLKLSGIDTAITNATKNKVDKVAGKMLSTNDYTTEEKNKLAGLSNYDDTAIVNKITILETKGTELEESIKTKANIIDVDTKIEVEKNRAIAEENKLNSKITVMEENGNALIPDVANGKQIIANAITEKGVFTKSTDSYQTMANNIRQIYKGSYDESFKVLIDDTLPSPEVTRVGEPTFANWLEENTHNIMVKNGAVNYYLDRENSLKKQNGTQAIIDGTDGDIMIKLPRFWYSVVESSKGLEISFSKIPQESTGWEESPELWVGATEAVIEKRDSNNIARSCYNTTANFRGGSNTAGWDGTKKSLLGMPRTNMTRASFRTACSNQGNFDSGIYHQYDFRTNLKLNLMFMCIYGTRNWQAPFSGYDLSTGKEKRNSDGFKYGGLGVGVATLDSATWNAYNSFNPFIPTNTGLNLGVRNGIVEYSVDFSTNDTPNVKHFNVPVFLGIINIYGHLWKFVDGVTKEVFLQGNMPTTRWALFDDVKKYTDASSEGAYYTVEVTGLKSGYIKKLNKKFLVVSTGGDSLSYYTDYFYHNDTSSWYNYIVSGSASYGSNCGGWSVDSFDGVASSYSHLGARLCFAPRIL